MAVVQRKRLLIDALTGAAPEVVEDVLAALDRLLAHPYAPLDVESFEVKLGPHDGARAALLGHGVWITYTVEERVPPTLQTVVQLRDVRRMDLPAVDLPVLPDRLPVASSAPTDPATAPRWWQAALAAVSAVLAAAGIAWVWRRRRG